jgi:hypothetical protein
MAYAAYRVAVGTILAGAYLRTGLVLLATLRTVTTRQSFKSFRVGWVEVACAVEPPLLLIVTWRLQGTLLPAAVVTPGAT